MNNSILIVLLKKKLFVFEKNMSQGSKLVPIFGESALPWTNENSSEAFRKLKNEIADLHNEHDLTKIDIDIVYDDVDSIVLKEITDAVLPCNHLQLFYLWKIVPQILFNIQKLKAYNKRIVVEYNQTKYSVSLDQNKRLKLSKSDETPEIIVHVEDLPRYLNLLI